MRFAVFADIHGNWEALEAALDFASSKGLDRFILLGDSIGYGANPNECLTWAFRHAELHVLGNHEAAVLHERIRERFTFSAREAIDWTAQWLSPELTERLKKLSYVQIAGNLTLAHGTINSPEEFYYLLDENEADQSFLALQTTFGFVAHSHVPCYFSEPGACGHLKAGVMKLKKKERYILNPGSIGQPRDQDSRLAFGIFDEDELTFEIVRLPYDNKKASDKILAEGLPAELAYRLM